MSWDKVTSKFDFYENKKQLKNLSHVAHLWHLFEPMLSKLNRDSDIILDYGCGVGTFCNVVDSYGYSIEGYDTSKQMINLARENSPDSIKYFQDASKLVKSGDKYQLILSTMVFQFINNFEDFLKNLSLNLKIGGKVCFAVHSKDFVLYKDHPSSKFITTNYSSENPKVILSIPPATFELYPRTACYYKSIFKKLNFSLDFEEYSQGPDESTPPKYLAMSFSRN